MTVVTVAAVIVAAPAIAGAIGTAALYYGASVATAGELSTVVTVGCAVVATGVAVTGINRAVEAATGTNYGAELLGEENYNNIESGINIVAKVISAAPETLKYPSTGRTKPKANAIKFSKAKSTIGRLLKMNIGDSRMPGWML